MQSTYQYKVGEKLQTMLGRPGAYTITELEKVPESEYPFTFARYKFKAVDFSRKIKTFDLKTFKDIMDHPKIVGWVDKEGRWFN